MVIGVSHAHEAGFYSQITAGRLELPRQPVNQRIGREHAGTGTMQGRQRSQFGVAPLQPSGLHDLQVPDTIEFALAVEPLQFTGRIGFSHNIFAAQIQRKVIGLQIGHQLFSPLNTQSCFERAGWIVETGVQHLTVTGADAQPTAGFPLHHQALPAGGDLEVAGHRQTDHATSYDR